jgi:hypothetical protein
VLAPFHRSIADYLKSQMKSGTVRADLNAPAFAELFTATLMGGFCEEHPVSRN